MEQPHHPDADPESELHAKIAKLERERAEQSARLSEFELGPHPHPDAPNGNEPDPLDIATKAIAFMGTQALAAVKKIAYLMEHAEKETVQLNAAKYIADRTLYDRNTSQTPASDPIAAYIEANRIADS